jgi:hypothetical protein
MAKFSDDEAACILAESRAILERREYELCAPAEEVSEPELESILRQPCETRNQRDRREIEERNARWAEGRRMSRARRILIDTVAARQLEAKCAAMIDQAQAKQRDYVSQLLTELLAAFRDDVMGEVDAAFGEMRKQLAELGKARGLDDTSGSDEPIDLPNPLAMRRLQ